MSEPIADKIASVRRKHGNVSLARGAFAGLAALVLLVGLEMFLDWVWELPMPVRAAMLAVDVLGLGWVLFQATIRPLVWGPDEDEIALMVEREVPILGTRLIAAVQLARPGALQPGASVQLARAVIWQAEQLAQSIHFPDVVKTDRLARTALLSALILLAGIGSFAWTQETSIELLKRTFLVDVPVPRKTRIAIEKAERVIAIGDTISLEAVVSGVVPTSGRLDISYASGRKIWYPLEPTADDSRKFVRTIENVQESFSYRIRLNDSTTSWLKVRAVPRPAVAGVEFTMIYPPYIKLPPEHKSPGDLSLLAGGKLQLKVKATKPLKSAAVRMVGGEKDIPLALAGSKRNEATGTVDIPAKNLTGLSFPLVDEENIGSRNETVFPVDLIPDRDPTLRITYPDRRDETATAIAKLLLAFEATDDFGIAKVILWRKLETEDNAAAKAVELDLAGASPEELRHLVRRHEFDISSMKPKEGSVVEYWLEVQDGNTVTGPGKAVSDHYKVKIVSDLEKKAELLNRVNDQFGTIDFLTQDQEKLNQTLGKLITEKR
ncbi:MAG: hypothetical protein ACHRHE_03760 [Tepidisphaerales bacterium]